MTKLKEFIFRNLFAVIIFLLSFCVVSVWFYSGRQLAGGEESFSIFNNRNLVELDNVWEEVGTGFANPTYLPRISVDLFVIFLRSFHLSLWQIQALFFYLVILSGILGFFYLTKHIGDKKDYLFFSLFSSLFYFLNLYSQSQVFGRFLYSSILAWAYLPIFLLLWVNWISTRDKKWLVFIALSSFIFSLTYLQPANIITIWFPAGLWSIIVAFKTKRSFEELIKLIAASALGVIVWLVANTWWIFPYFKLANSSFKSFGGTLANFNSLLGVSQYFPSSQVLLLRQGFIFGDKSFISDHVGFPLPYNGWYNQLWVWGISVVIFLIVILGIFVGRKRRAWLFLIVLFFIGWFVSKGANPPFGKEFFSFAFNIFPPLQAFRNPYEKFGIVFLLPYAIFFGLGLDWLISRVRDLNKKILLVILTLFLFYGLFVWPIWSGKLFGSGVTNNLVKVPHSYLEVNNFLNQDKDDFRILVLPLLPGDGLRYNWRSGYYQGLEPSVFLFDRPAISRVLRVEYFGDKYMNLYSSFINGSKYNHFLNEMNIKYLVLHYDLDSKISGASTSAEVKKTLEKNKKVKYVKKFGELEIYQYTGNKNPGLFIVQGQNVPKISYQKLSSTRYRVFVKNAKEPFDLIFRETFSKFWEARVRNKELKDHFLVYNYANGWRINEKGDYIIDIIFKIWPWE